jgi:hypothetical protein
MTLPLPEIGNVTPWEESMSTLSSKKNARCPDEPSFIYSDQSPGEKRVRITHDWAERENAATPGTPAGPVFPPHRGFSDGTNIVFRWNAPTTAAAQSPILDYQFELSDRPDMLWPLSPNFYKLISKTADRGKPQYTLPEGGLLSPGQTYYWRVKAKYETGVWGAWSDVWSFTPRGIASPINLVLAADSERATGMLRWQPNQAGDKPAAYRIYASDERGFSISDGEFMAVAGTSKLVSTRRPPNFVAETSGTELAVIGANLGLSNGNRVYYRVVAVDGQGNRSGPSDFIEAPRPMLVSQPVETAKAGSEYRYAVVCLRSLGDLRTRVVGGKETMNYWDIETPRFAIEQGPAWLKIDPTTGVLTGMPDHSGNTQVTVSATIDKEDRKLDASLLSWGIEKTLTTSMKRSGVAKQSFRIDVAP